jgi:hypothetical protein
VSLRGVLGVSKHSQVIGAAVPSYSKFPYRARDTLRLYRDFWRLINKMPPAERPDLAFQVRNEFRSKRHAMGERRISSAINRGMAVLATQQQMFDSKAMRSSGVFKRAVKGGGADGRVDANGRRRGGAGRSEALTVDGVWEQLRVHGEGTLPNLRNVLTSRRKAGTYRTAQHHSGGR